MNFCTHISASVFLVPVLSIMLLSFIMFCPFQAPLFDAPKMTDVPHPSSLIITVEVSEGRRTSLKKPALFFFHFFDVMVNLMGGIGPDCHMERLCLSKVPSAAVFPGMLCLLCLNAMLL